LKAVVTGAAGFIGSHLTDALLGSGWKVLGIDNLATGTEENLASAFRNKEFEFRRIDLRQRVDSALFDSTSILFHLAADPQVRTGLANPESQFENNVLATYNILEGVRKSGIRRIYLASSSTVYGEPSICPTSEEYLPLVPISIYGTSKLICENLAQGYSKTFGVQSIVLRPANVVGSRATHGVVLDFLNKLRKDSSVLEILGDGKQSKSYVDVGDVVSAVLKIEENAPGLDTLETFNIGNRGETSVLRIAQIVCEEFGGNSRLEFSGGIDGGRAWKGDVRRVLLSTEKLERIGWRPNLDSDQSIRNAVKSLLKS
jgi:UDP-glucose 4-epimerase